MDTKVLQSVVEITEQRNTLSLGHCVIATLAEMLPVTCVQLMQFEGNRSYLIAKLKVEKGKDGSREYNWEYGGEVEFLSEHDHKRDEIEILKRDSGGYIFHNPIPIDDTSSAILSFSMKSNPEKFQLLIDGFAKVYKNYLLVLHESERDKLTGLLNRKTLEERLSRSFELNSDYHNEDAPHAWVSLIDLDHFKSINDNFGHMIGDEVLLTFAQQMQNFFGSDEQLFRFGGEEFVIIFSPSELHVVKAKMEAFRQHIEDYKFPQVGELTISGGLCSVNKHDYIPTILDHADKALYHAKGNGRNQIHCYEQLVEQGILASKVVVDDDVELF